MALVLVHVQSKCRSALSQKRFLWHMEGMPGLTLEVRVVPLAGVKTKQEARLVLEDCVGVAGSLDRRKKHIAQAKSATQPSRRLT